MNVSSIQNSIDDINQTPNTKKKIKTPISEDIIPGLDNDSLLDAIHQCDNLIRAGQYQIWRSHEDKRLLLEEIENRTTKLVDFQAAHVDSLNECIVFNNELIKAFVDVYENNLSVLITLFDQVSNHLSLMNSIKSNLESRLHIDGNSALDSMTSELKKGQVLKENLFDVLSSDYSKNISNIYGPGYTEQLIFDRDDAYEENKLLKRTIHQQTHIISQLAAENRLLVKFRDTPNDNPKVNAVTESLNVMLDPFRLTCSKYQQEMKRCNRNLEDLIRAAKLENISYYKDTSNDMGSETIKLMQKCNECEETINSILPHVTSCLQKRNLTAVRDNINFIRDKVNKILK